MKLSDCRPGEGGTIERVGGAGRTLQRLLELGIVEGRAVRVIRVAPLGDPIEVRLGDALLSLRRSEAASVEVAP